ncbi:MULTISPECIES: dihydrofolate reductase family protein [unclassified Cryobacterium]|uniref:dihydrofolate reductase family protein n=1 Tax=unclassified Cryobacterium TaxID=2649013 RepID=UPI00106ADEC2|nr:MULTISPECIES: dihydrofolate reductase family protein [unclassified Cryobacterium]TFC60927.1 dihydrofolate reductase [Cryobacterium sp. TMB1-7]TFC92297.1 dihydrofolate reductase [Cryobacterium sp. TMT4-31]
MTPVTCDITVSTDGYAAGPNQSLENPLGEGGMRLHRWALEQPAENAAQMEAILEAGAYIMGRNMFGPGRGEWDDEWTGWWGDEPPYHAPVFVLTHYPRAPLVMAGGTTFTFVTDGIESALEQARAAAGELSVAIAGGASTVRQYLAAGLIDELRLHIAQVVQGTGEPLLEGLDDVRLEQVSSVENELVTHVLRVVH